MTEEERRQLGLTNIHAADPAYSKEEWPGGVAWGSTRHTYRWLFWNFLYSRPFKPDDWRPFKTGRYLFFGLWYVPNLKVEWVNIKETKFDVLHIGGQDDGTIK